MTRRILAAMMFLCISSSLISFAQETKWLITPFYKSQVMEGESMFFIEEKPGEPAQASLLFTPTKIASVTSATGETVYREGQDYLWLPGTNVIKRTQDSRIPFNRLLKKPYKISKLSELRCCSRLTHSEFTYAQSRSRSDRYVQLYFA